VVTIYQLVIRKEMNIKRLKNIFVKTDDKENHGEAEPWEKK